MDKIKRIVLCAMDQRTLQILFALLRSAVCGEKLTKEEQSDYSPEMLRDLLSMSSKHDFAHLLAHGINQNNILSEENAELGRLVSGANYHCE